MLVFINMPVSGLLAVIVVSDHCMASGLVVPTALDMHSHLKAKGDRVRQLRTNRASAECFYSKRLEGHAQTAILP